MISLSVFVNVGNFYKVVQLSEKDASLGIMGARLKSLGTHHGSNAAEGFKGESSNEPPLYRGVLGYRANEAIHSNLIQTKRLASLGIMREQLRAP